MRKQDLDRARTAAAAVLDVPPEDVTVRVRRAPGRPATISDADLLAAVEREGGIRAAARKLKMSDSGLARRVRALRSGRAARTSKEST